MSQPTATHIYIVAFSDGVIKVGRTQNVRQRFAGLKSSAGKRNASITKSWVRRDVDARLGEFYLRLLGRHFLTRAWGAEHFFGDFDTFVASVEGRLEEWGYDSNLSRDEVAA